MKILSFILFILAVPHSSVPGTDSFKKNTVPSPVNAEMKRNEDRPSDAASLSEEIKNWQSYRRTALIVGVSDYRPGSGLRRLNFGSSDSQKMGSVLKDVGKFTEIVVLNDELGKADPKLRPTKENILRERDRLLEMNPHLFLFYFSGHGFELKGENIVTPSDTVMGTENAEALNTLNIASEIIEEAKSYNKKRKEKSSEPEEEDRFSHIRDGAEQVIVFLDACREAARDGKAGVGKPFSDFPERIKTAKGVAIFLGTSEGGFSYEDGQLAGGVFTHFLVKGISGEVQNNGAEYVTFNGLKEYVEKATAEYIRLKGRNKQIPIAAGEYKGDFLLAVGRPGSEIKVETVQYRSKSGDRVNSKRIIDSKGRRLRLSFFNESEDGSIFPASLDGISHLVFKYNEKCMLSAAAFSLLNEEDFTESCFEASQFDPQGNLDFRHAVRYIPKRGWEIRRTYRDEAGTRNAVRGENRETPVQFQKLEYSFNGSLVRNEYQGKYSINKKDILSETPAADEESIAKVIQNYDISSKRTLEEYYGADGRLRSNSRKTARTVFAYDSAGNLIMKMYTDEKGLQAKDKYDVYKTVYEYDYSRNEYGLRTKITHFGKSEDVLSEGDAGISVTEYEYDENCIQSFPKTAESAMNFSCVKEIRYKGKDNRLKGNRIKKKTALAKFKYDEKGRLIEERYFGENGLPKSVKDGISGYQYKYSELCWNRMKSHSDYLPIPKCRETDAACKSKEELVFTCVDEIRTLNSSGFPEADPDGIAVFRYRYDAGCMSYIQDKKECISADETLDAAEKKTAYPKERSIIHYNEKCLETNKTSAECISLEENYGTDGKLKMKQEAGYARRKLIFDDYGNPVQEEFFDAVGKPVENSRGYARKKMKYSENGMHTLSEYFGTDGKLTENKAGYAVKKFEYNSINKLILEETYNSAGRLTDKKGYARKIWKYDELGRNIEYETQNRDSQPALYKEGYSRKTLEYDSRGRTAAENYFGTDRQKKLNREGYARKEIQYDSNDKIIMEKYFGTSGELKENIYGYVQKKINYNDQNQHILSEYFGADGKLKNNASGYARKVMNYDRMGNLSLEETYDSERNLTDKTKDSSFARKMMKYNEECLRKGRDHIQRNRDCISYLELYDKNEILKSVRKNVFSREGNYMESLEFPDLKGTKKWSILENRLRFEEKMELLTEVKSVKKEDGYAEKKEEHSVLMNARYFMEFPNPKGAEGRRKVIVELDRLYRPSGIAFE